MHPQWDLLFSGAFENVGGGGGRKQTRDQSKAVGQKPQFQCGG